MRRLTSTAALAVALTLTALTTPAGADAGPKLPKRGLFVLPGLTLGGTSSFDVGTGFTLGGELSMAYWYRGLWAGLVSDGLYDWQRDHGRFMFGAEAGWGPIGLDGGYLLEVGEGGPFHGLGLRLVFSIGVVQLYTRYGGMFNAPDFMEWGLLIKVPLSIFSEYPPRRLHRHQQRDQLPTPDAAGPNKGPDAGPNVAPSGPIKPPAPSGQR